jgi:hypothetical protein
VPDAAALGAVMTYSDDVAHRPAVLWELTTMGKRTVDQQFRRVGSPVRTQLRIGLRSRSLIAGPAAVLLLSTALCACGSNPPTSAQASTPSASPAAQTPDPCKALSDDQIDAAFSAAGQKFASPALTAYDTDKAGADAAGAEFSCVWSALESNGSLSAVFSVLTLIVQPAAGYGAAHCAKSVAGLGQAACLDGSGFLHVKDGSFELTVEQTSPRTPDPTTVEQPLGADAIAAISSGAAAS